MNVQTFHEYPILRECFDAYRAKASTVLFPLDRLNEFIDAGTCWRLFDFDELNKFREACLNDEAKAFGVPVLFVPR